MVLTLGKRDVRVTHEKRIIYCRSSPNWCRRFEQSVESSTNPISHAMHSTQLESVKYLQNDQGQIEFNEFKEARQRDWKKIGGSLFRAILILGIAASVYWFYRNQDPILTNIRNNSGNYAAFFNSLGDKPISPSADAGAQR